MSTTDQIGGIVSDFLNSIIHSPAVETSVRFAAWGLVILWVVTVLWAFRDALSRTHNVIAVLGAPAVILAATPLGFPLAVLVWRILRPQRTIAEAREQQLTIDALTASTRRPLCEGCGSKVNAEWRRCPWCRTWLLAPCPRCERTVELAASVCPWCAFELFPGVLVPRVGAPSMVPVMASYTSMTPVMARPHAEPTAATMPVAVPVGHMTADEPAATDTLRPEPAPEPAWASAEPRDPAGRLWEPAAAATPDLAPQPASAPADPSGRLWGPLASATPEVSAAPGSEAAPAPDRPAPMEPATLLSAAAMPAPETGWAPLGPTQPTEPGSGPSSARHPRRPRGRLAKHEPQQPSDQPAPSSALW